MIALIPYKEDGGVQLRYCIRSLHQYFKPLTGVLLVGDKPDWYTGDYLYHPNAKGERSPGKEQNLVAKVLSADMKAPFLYCHDDIYLLRDHDDMPYYYYGTCLAAGSNEGSSDYRAMYRRCPPSWKKYDIHNPMIFDPVIFEREHTFDFPIKTNYANRAGIEGVPLLDMKIKGKKTMAEIRELISGRPFFSTHDNAIHPPMIEIFNSLYPSPSPYEQAVGI